MNYQAWEIACKAEYRSNQQRWILDLRVRRGLLLLVLGRMTIHSRDRVGITLFVPLEVLVSIEEPATSSRFPNSDKTFRYSWSVELYDTAWESFESS